MTHRTTLFCVREIPMNGSRLPNARAVLVHTCDSKLSTSFSCSTMASETRLWPWNLFPQWW
jgi:hypothetical protein